MIRVLSSCLESSVLDGKLVPYFSFFLIYDYCDSGRCFEGVMEFDVSSGVDA